MIRNSSLLEKILSKYDLTEVESYLLLKSIFSGELTQNQIAAFLTALRFKGESVSEVIGFIRAMREVMVQVPCSDPVIVDTCGTGGDGKKSFNISTAAAFVVAGAGLKVAKHGNRSQSSQCGSADILEELGVDIQMPHSVAARCLNEIGITFLFAPHYHPAMKQVGPVRKELGIRTIFNLLGPLVNPARASVQVIGVSNQNHRSLLSKVFEEMTLKEKKSVCILHDSGYDECVLSKEGLGTLIQDGISKELDLSYKSFQMGPCSFDSLLGGDAKENGIILKKILSNEILPLKEVVLANSALAICTAQSFSHERFQLLDAVHLAKESLESGRALAKLKSLIEWSHKS